MRIILAVVVVFIALLFVAYRADTSYCDRMLSASKTNTDTLIVLTSRRCVFIAKEIR